MTTLKGHQQAMVDLLASGSGIPASASRLAHATYYILETIILANLTEPEKAELIDNRRPDATTPGLNDKALAADVEACRPKVTMFDRARAAERRVKALENTVNQLRAINAKLTEERDYWIRTCRGNEQKLIRTRQELETTKALPEQAGCRKEDTQVCEHRHTVVEDGGSIRCIQCGAKL